MTRDSFTHDRQWRIYTFFQLCFLSSVLSQLLKIVSLPVKISLPVVIVTIMSALTGISVDVGQIPILSVMDSSTVIVSTLSGIPSIPGY